MNILKSRLGTKKIFQNNSIEVTKNVKLLPLKMGDLKYIKIRENIDFSEVIFMLFGSSLIREKFQIPKEKKSYQYTHGNLSLL